MLDAAVSSVMDKEDADMERFCCQGAYIDYCAHVTCDNEKHKLVITRETQQPAPYFRKTRLKITNQGTEAVFLKEAMPVVSEALVLGDSSEKWQLLIHGRHKNDLPSTCVTGLRDERFQDCVNRLSEEGSVISANIADEVTFHSDLLTMINGGAHSAAFLVLSSGAQLTTCDITIDRDGKFQKLCAGGEFNCLLEPGQTRFTEWIGMDFRSDWNAVTDDFAQIRAKKRTVRHSAPSVYSTWYYYGEEITSADVDTNLAKIKEKVLPFTCFQIDDGWEKCYGDWEPNEKFPDICKTASQIQNAGMMAGIWTCPFVADMESTLDREHKDWMLRHTDGSFCEFKMGSKYYHVLDLTNPEVLSWMEALYEKLVAWGYRYHKLDFTRAFPIQKDIRPFNPCKTVVEAYMDGMGCVRRALGEEGYLEVCGGLYDPLIGIADAQRTGSDVKSMWKDPGKDKPKIPLTVKQNILRYFMNEWWHNDPDSLMVRRNSENRRPSYLDMGLLNDEEVKIFTLNQYAGGGLVCSTEALDSIEEDRLMLLRHIMPVVDTKVTPTELFGSQRYPDSVDVTVKGKWHTLCLFNWSDEKKPVSITLDERLCGGFIEKDKNYLVAEFFSGTVVSNAGFGDHVELPDMEPHSALAVKIADRSQPQIACSNMHFSMGGELEELKIVADALTAEKEELKVVFEHRYRYPLRYTIFLPEGYVTAEGSENVVAVSADEPGRLELSFAVKHL